MKRLLFPAAVTVAMLTGTQLMRAQSAAREAGYLYLSPVPGAPYVSDQTRFVLVRFAQATPSAVTNLLTDFITVTGTETGPHPGATHVALDGRTVIFTMGTDFSSNEVVTVTLNPMGKPVRSGLVQPFQYQFSITAPMPGIRLQAVGRAKKPLQPIFHSNEKHMQSHTSARRVKRGTVANAMLMPNGVSVPSDFPQVVITANTNPSPGYLFLENGLDDIPPYTMMLDNHGLPVWYRRGRMYDFKIQKNGMITWCLSDDTGFPAFDQNFNYLKTYLTTNGYFTDGHDLKILPDGTYFMIGHRNNPVDMGLYLQGVGNAIVTETVIQEFTAADELIFQWRAWDHYNIADPPMYNTDFPHMNGIDIDEDGNILVSARHLSEVTKIDRDSGDIIWRLSGLHSDFTFVDDSFNGTSFQHNISALGNSHYMVFDNGDLHEPMASRAAEYQLDLTNKTATLVWQFRDAPDKYAYYLGSAQRLPTGNTLINFVLAGYPKAIEVDTNGLKHFELSLVPGADAYRAFRFPWNGVVAAPYLIVEPQVNNITLVFNKFGDTNVSYYRIYGGTSSGSTNVLAESLTTVKRLSNLQNGTYFFRVTAVSTQGVESAFSNEESTDVNIIQPGMNMVQNGDFSLGTNAWEFTTRGTSGAEWIVANDVSQCYIISGGTTLDSIQLVQTNLALIESNKYVLEFDAWSSQPRYVEVKLGSSLSPFTDYSLITPPFLTPNPTHYRYVITMLQPSDFSAAVVFDLGGSNVAVYLANVSLFNPPLGDLNLDGRVDLVDLSAFAGSWLKQQPGLPADLNGDGKVDFGDFSTFGQNWTPGGLSKSAARSR
jgi:hypothetical protein